MRKENAGFRTAFLSEEGSKLLNRDYFAYVELDNLACYVAADSLDDEKSKNSAEIVVKSILREFTEHPSLSLSAIRRYLKKAHRELLSDKDGMRLRASVSMFVTNYVKFRYASVGNARVALIRNDRILYESRDQSLTENMVETERLPKDKAALHEERNNLYSYLGQADKQPQFQVSKKRKLSNGDILLLYTRGIWENCVSAELLDCAREVSDPQELSDNVEECILGKLKEEIDNYTISVTFVDKVYLNPKKKMSLKKILAIVIPVALILLLLLIGFFVRWHVREGKRQDMEQYMASAWEYVSYHNFEKAAEEYQEAQALAKALKSEKVQEEISQWLHFLEQAIQGDKAMSEAEYDKAEKFYQKARGFSGKMGDLCADYFKVQQKKIDDYRILFELLESAEVKEDYGDYAGAIELYKQAKSKAGTLYDKDIRNEALEKQRSAEESLETLRKEELTALEEKIQKAIEEEQVAQELDNQSLMNDKKNALELESKGNDLMKEEDYLSAITYFETAMGMYEDLEMPERVGTLSEQIASCKKLQEEAEKKAAREAEQKAQEDQQKAQEAEQQAKEETKAREAEQAAQEARQALLDLQQAQTNQVLEDAKKAVQEAKDAAEETKKALEESKKNSEKDSTQENGKDESNKDETGSDEITLDTDGQNEGNGG